MSESLRKTIPFYQTMHRYLSEMERNLFSAEVMCDENKALCTDCPFYKNEECDMDKIRELIPQVIS